MEPQDLTFSQGLGPIRSADERARQILGRGPQDLSESDVVFLDLYLQNFDHVKGRLEALLESYINDPPIVADLVDFSSSFFFLCSLFFLFCSLLSRIVWI